jgi:hypothetical protein
VGLVAAVVDTHLDAFDPHDLGHTVAALVRPEPTGFGVTSVRALLWPGAFVEGDNEISVHLLGGDEDTGAVLHPLDVTTR